MPKKLSLFERITGRVSEPVTNGSAPTVVQGTRQSGYTLGSTVLKQVTPSELYVGYAAAAIKVVASRFASEMMQNLRVYDKARKEVPLDRHPMGQTLINPQFGVTQYDIWEQVATNMMVFGSAYPHFLRNEARTKHVGLEVLPSNRIVVESTDQATNQIKSYEYRAGGGFVYSIQAEDIMLLKQYNPSNPGDGFSSIAAAGDHHITEQAAAAHVKNHLYNSGFQNLIVQLGEQMDADAFEALKRDFAQMYSGASASGKNIFLNGIQAEVKELSSKLSDLDISSVSKVAVDGILSSIGVSRAMIGLEGENLNRATAEVQERQMVQNVITPLIRRTVDGFNVFTGQYTQYASQGFTFGFIDPSVESVDEELVKAQTIAAKSQSVAVLVSAGMGLDEAKLIAGIDDQDTNASTGETSEAKAIVTSKLKAVKNAKSKLTASKWTRWQKQNGEARIDDATASLINGLEKHYQKLRAKILRQFRKDNAFGVSDVFVIDEAAAVAAEIRPALLNLYGLAGREAMDFMWEMSQADTILEAPFKPGASVLERTSALIDRAAKAVSDTNSELINRIIQEGIALEKTQTQIAAEIDTAFNGEIERWRADRLARTEVVRVNALGEQDAVQQWAEIVGAQVNKIWRTNSPEPCQFCRSLNGTKVGVSELFVGQGGKVQGVDGGLLRNEYDDLETPPIHPNCACSVTMEVE